MNYDFNPWYYIDIYKKWWKAIIIVMFVSMGLTAVFLRLSSTTMYVSNVSILTTDKFAAGSSVGGFLGIPSLSVGPSSADVIISIIKSKRMAKDINSNFSLAKKKGFIYSLDAYSAKAELIVRVTASDPILTRDIANFVVANLDKINSELEISSNKPMVKVLDPAESASPLPKENKRKILVAGLLAFLLSSFYIFGTDFLKKLKR